MPSANTPRLNTPQAPQVPWTETAPTGSSTFSVLSTKNTLQHTRMPATAPITNAQKLETNAQGAVIATSPASMPLAIMLGSGLPKRAHM